MIVVESNVYREKTNEELYRELKVRKRFIAKKSGVRTDLNPNLSDEERMHTDDRLAKDMNISASKVSKLEKVGDTNPALLKMTDTPDGPSLSEAYAACLPDKPKHEPAVPVIDLDNIEACPTCGQQTARIVKIADGKLAYQQKGGSHE